MKWLVLLSLISCVSLKKETPKCTKYYCKLEDCMEKFSDQGFSAENIINICKAAHDRH